jgi:hypothetical protein
MVGQRVGLFENSKVLLPVLGLSLGIMLLTLLLAPIALARTTPLWQKT